MSVSDAELGDIYADDAGKLWRVTAICRDPTVTMESVEPTGHSSDPPDPLTMMITDVTGVSTGRVKGFFIRDRKAGSVHGAMWNGFTRLLRRPA